MESLKQIHSVALAELQQKFSLNPVALKYPFPERPLRTLGIAKVDGEVFSAEKLARVVLFRLNLPTYLSVFSTFLRPRLEYDLPVFTCETVCMGKKRMFILDIHRAGEGTHHDDTALFDHLIAIRNKYPALLANSTKQAGEIQSVFSRAACQVRITDERDGDALHLFQEYLAVFCEMVAKAAPLAGEVLDNTKQAYDRYLKTVVDHDPGVNGYKKLFGKQGGLVRALDIFFAQ